MSFTKNEMEKMAEEFRADLGLKDDMPLDPFLIEVQGVKIISLDELPELDKGTKKQLNETGSRSWSAMSVPIDDEHNDWVILYNKTNDKERTRVSILEELWHIFLGHKLTTVVKVGSCYGRSYESNEEHDAYYIAAASMLPESQIQRFVKNEEDASVAAKRFGVSRELVEYRVKRLGLWRAYQRRRVSLKSAAEAGQG